MSDIQKITSSHLTRVAVVYLRQSSAAQVEHNRESTDRQYALVHKAGELGWPTDRVVVIDEDLGLTGSGAVARSGFARLTAEVALGHVGLVLGLEVSRLARNNADWYRLIDLCGLSNTLIADADGVYDPANYNDRLLLGLKGTMSEAELYVLRARLNGGIRNKAARGELRRGLPVGFVWGEADGEVRFHPDEGVRTTIASVFTRFAETGSARRVWLWFRLHGLRLPLRMHQGWEIRWVEASYTAIHQVLSNPVYAGAYAYGKTRQEVMERRRRLVAGETPHATGRRRRAGQGCARPATHGGDRDAAPWRAAREDRVGPAALRHRHDGPLRQGRCRAPEANRAALAGGPLMLKAIEAYLALRRATGFAMLNAECLLKSFAAFATERGQTHVHAQTAIDWAARGPSVAQRDARLRAVCRFVRHVRVEDARHELPPVNHFGARKTRRSPHIYSAAEIDRLIEAALRLRPKGALRPWTYATLIALLSVTGLRISEALKLTVADITRDGLLIRETKFRKTRLAPLHDTAVAGLKRYLARRRPRSEADRVFADARALPLRYNAVKKTFDRLVDRAGVAPPARRRPRLHDLRHTFAVRTLQGSQSGGSKPKGAHMAALATYMGHVNIYATYWDLEATADLMRDVAAACEEFIAEGRQS